jgi:lysophospholipase L1-like esterase
VIILGDNHLKGCVVKFRSELSAKFKVSGKIRPGAGSEKIVNSSVEDLLNLHLQDVIVLNTGANDVYRNAKGLALTQITKFIQRNYGANIIIIDIPQRYDLSPSSCINLQIEELNRKLNKITTLYNHVSLLETNFKRECFTRHGLHWNSLGKSLVVKLLLHQINK